MVGVGSAVTAAILLLFCFAVAGKQAWIIHCGSTVAPLEQFVISDLPYSMHSS